MRVFLCALSIFGLMGSAAAAANPATQQGADRLTAAFRSYLGDTAGLVTVQPEDEVYGVTLDFGALSSKLAADQGSLTLSPIELKLTDNGDGTWGVHQDQPFAYAFSLPGKFTMSVHIGKLKQEGIFDTKMMAFSRFEVEASDIDSNQVETLLGQPVQTVTMHMDSMRGSGTGKPAADGDGVDVTQNLSHGAFTERITLPPVGAGASSTDLTLTAASIDAKIDITGLRPEAVFKLVAFAVANPSKPAIVARQGELKTMLAAGLPIWKHLAADETVSALGVQSPVGQGSLDKMAVTVEMNGVVPDGMVREAFTLSGLHLPDGLVPDWARTLVPATLSMDFTLARFDLAAPARILLDTIDLATEPALPAGTDTKLLAALLPDGLADLTLAPGTTEAPAYKLGYAGTMSFGPDKTPVAKARVTLTGMDKIRAALAAAPVEIGSKASMGLGMAGGLAKPGAAGELAWDIETDPKGKLLVNGMDMSAMTGGQ